MSEKIAVESMTIEPFENESSSDSHEETVGTNVPTELTVRKRTSDYSMFDAVKTDILDDLSTLNETISNNETNRGTKKLEERFATYVISPKMLSMNDIIQFPYMGEEWDELKRIIDRQYEKSPNIAYPNHAASVIGPYVAIRAIKGTVEPFWDHHNAFKNSRNNKDYGTDIIGMNIDFKTTLIRKEHLLYPNKYSVLDYILAIPPHIKKKSNRQGHVIAQLLVHWLRDDGTANVYLTGWATVEDFPDTGEQYPNGAEQHYINQHCLYGYQLKAHAPFQFDSNVKEVHELAFKDSRWKDFPLRPFKNYVEQTPPVLSDEFE